MAVALLIVVLLLGSLLAPLSTQVEQRKISEAQRGLEQVNEALIGFALAQTPPRLPCPDTNNDGVEDACAAGAGASYGGNVPWVTLGLPSQDPWGQRYRYRVNGAFVFAITLASSGTGAGQVRVCTDSTCANLVASNVPALVWSGGPNGTQAPASGDEIENNNNDRTFVSRPLSNVAGAEFDDLVTFLSGPVLLSRLVSAQKLP